MKSDLDLIWGYFDGELEEQEMKVMEQRLDSDPEFQDLFNEQKEIHQSLLKTDIIAFRKKVRKIGDKLRKSKPTGGMIILSYPWLIAAATGLLCLTTGYFLLRLTAGETVSPPVISSSQPFRDSANTLMEDTLYSNQDAMTEGGLQETITDTEPDRESSNNLLAESFRIHSTLEKLTGIHYRNGILKSAWPENGQTFTSGSVIVFTCLTEPSDSVFLTILNNKAQVILGKPMPSGTFVWEPDRPVGLYYFQMSSGKELLCTRKIYVR